MESKCKFEITPIQIKYNKEILERWRTGDRLDCQDEYIKSMNKGTNGFGEYIAGKYFESMGYKWIHHDYNVLGGNKLGKYPESQAIIEKFVGQEKFNILRTIYPTFKPLEEPDLMIYNDDATEVIFAEAKRVDTKDKLRESQLRGLILLSILLNTKVYVCEIVPDYWDKDPQKILYYL